MNYIIVYYIKLYASFCTLFGRQLRGRQNNIMLQQILDLAVQAMK